MRRSCDPDPSVLARLYSDPLDLTIAALRARREQLDAMIRLLEFEKSQPSIEFQQMGTATLQQGMATSITGLTAATSKVT